MTNKDMSGQVAWVTGGGTGIGLETVQALARAKAVVVVSGRRQSELDSAVAAVRAAGGVAHALALDVSDAAAVTAAAAGILADQRGGFRSSAPV